MNLYLYLHVSVKQVFQNDQTWSILLSISSELWLASSCWNPEEVDLWPFLSTVFSGDMDLKEMVNRGTEKVNNVSALCTLHSRTKLG